MVEKILHFFFLSNRCFFILNGCRAENGLQISSSEARPPQYVIFQNLPKPGQLLEALGSIPLFALYGVLCFHHHHARCSIRRSGAVPIQTSVSIDIESPTIKPRATTGSRARPSPKHFFAQFLSYHQDAVRGFEAIR